MRITANELIKNFPPELRELALQRAKEQGRNRVTVLEKNVDRAFTWFDTKEGHDFWSNVHGGREFTFPTETSIEKFKRGDLVEAVSGYDKGMKGIYIGLNSSDIYTSIIQRTDGEGWNYSGSKSQFPTDFIPTSGALFWNMATKDLERQKRTTETAKPTPKFQMGDRVSTTYGMNGWFVCYTDTGTCIIERDEPEGWPRTNNPSLVPSNYVCKKHESFWSTSESALVKLAEKAEEKVEEKTKPTGFQVGDRVEARKSGWQNGVGRVMQTGEKGIITKIFGELIYLKAERDGVEICRIDEFLTKVPHEQLSKGAMGMYKFIEEIVAEVKPGRGGYTWEIPLGMFRPSYLSAVNPYDTFGASISVVERHPGAVLISKKKTKRRLL